MTTLTKNQKKHFTKEFSRDGKLCLIDVQVRYDDECGNGHNSFSITADIYEPTPQRGEATVRLSNERTAWLTSCGCQHEEIADHFPALAPLIKWHLCASDGPMYYLENTLYFAGDRDHNGRRKGEPSSFSKAIKFTGFPLEWDRSHGPHSNNKFIEWLGAMGGTASTRKVLPVPHEAKDGFKFDPKFTLDGFKCEWYQCPFESEREALQFVKALKLGFQVVIVPTAWSQGKDRELDKARLSAIWPEATDEQLSLPPEELAEALKARLPGLMTEFKTAVESLGFTF